MQKSKKNRIFTGKVGKRGVVVIPAPLRKSIGLDEGDLIVVQPTDDGLLIRPAVAVPIEKYSSRRKAEFLLSNATDLDDYAKAKKMVREMGLNPDDIDHVRPVSRKSNR